MSEAPQALFDGQLDLDPTASVFIDENMGQDQHGPHPRSLPGAASVCAWPSPTGHWKTTTFVAGLTRRGMIAPFVIGGPINRDAFETDVQRVLVPNCAPATSSSWTTCRATKGRGHAN